MGKIDFQAGGSGMAANDTAGEMVFYTTADGANTLASSLVPVMWRVPDNITID